MAKSNSSRSYRGSSSKSNTSRRPQPKSPPGGFSGRRSRYDEGGEID